MNGIKPPAKFIAFFVISLLVIPPQLVIMLFTRGNLAYVFPYFWQKAVCKIFAIKVEINGTPYTKSQTIFISNHISYLDIPAIGSVLKASFVAKKDVASWPVFGFLSKLQQTAFISRDRKDAAKEKNALDNMLIEGKSLIIFPEGTSTDGREVIPFKSSLFAIALKEEIKENLMIQPISLTMKSVNGKKPMSQEDRDIYSWHRDMDTPLGTHLWLFAESRGATISLNFHPPVYANEYSDRKTLAKQCHNAVSNGVNK